MPWYFTRETGEVDLLVAMNLGSGSLVMESFEGGALGGGAQVMAVGRVAGALSGDADPRGSGYCQGSGGLPNAPGGMIRFFRFKRVNNHSTREELETKHRRFGNDRPDEGQGQGGEAAALTQMLEQSSRLVLSVDQAHQSRRSTFLPRREAIFQNSYIASPGIT